MMIDSISHSNLGTYQQYNTLLCVLKTVHSSNRDNVDEWIDQIRSDQIRESQIDVMAPPIIHPFVFKARKKIAGR